MVNIEINGKSIKVAAGTMIIQAADELGIYIPRFCYHKKLSIAANCRMCLVEVENNRKTMPACATPVIDGMKVYTKSPATVHSQQAVMEFLLINHPLDCPICDQGGECELQDLSMGFGYSLTEYQESKRAVADENLGPLVATDMTRCIHCTRCVRFGDEVAGVRELGATDRGENMQIGTYVQHSMVSELSGNIIDLCPVGALTSKPFRFKARAWELAQKESIAPHDCLGSNIYLHIYHNTVMRVVPKENEAINETWLSDRDRFSYLGLNSQFRAQTPRIKKNGQWLTVSWEEALQFTAKGISDLIKQYGSSQFAAFAAPSSTLEEFYLLQKLMRTLGVNNLDHRIQQVDFSDQCHQASTPCSSLRYADLEKQNNCLLLGCNIHQEVPLAGVRIRKAYKNGAKIFAINAVDYDYNFTITDKIIIPPQEFPLQMAKLVLALTEDRSCLPVAAQKLLENLQVDAKTLNIASALQQPNATIITGSLCENHPQAALLRTFLYLIEQTGVKVLRLTTGANSAGAWLAGMVPHRTCGGEIIEQPGLNVQAALHARLKGYLLLAVEPGYDFANPYLARQSMLGAEFVVLLSAFQNESMQDYADVILPIAPYAETTGTYINVDKVWQTVPNRNVPCGEARPAWKILRVLGNLLHCKQFDYASPEEILLEIKLQLDLVTEKQYQPYYPEQLPTNDKRLIRVGEWPLYRCDMIVRHALALQDCAAAQSACIRIHPSTAQRFQLEATATIAQGNIEITLPLHQDSRITPDVVWVANAMPETIDLGHAFDDITIKR